MDHVLTTGRLVLRPVTAEDHAALLALWTVPEVRRFLFAGAVLSAAEIIGVIEDSARDFAAVGGSPPRSPAPSWSTPSARSG